MALENTTYSEQWINHLGLINDHSSKSDMQGDGLRTLQSCVPDLPVFFEDRGPHSGPVPPPAGKLPAKCFL